MSFWQIVSVADKQLLNFFFFFHDNRVLVGTLKLRLGTRFCGLLTIWIFYWVVHRLMRANFCIIFFIGNCLTTNSSFPSFWARKHNDLRACFKHVDEESTLVLMERRNSKIEKPGLLNKPREQIFLISQDLSLLQCCLHKDGWTICRVAYIWDFISGEKWGFRFVGMGKWGHTSIIKGERSYMLSSGSSLWLYLSSLLKYGGIILS